jgi:hypothetical protein
MHNEELLILYASPNTITMAKLRSTRWTGHVAQIGTRRKAYNFWWEIQKERDTRKT